MSPRSLSVCGAARGTQLNPRHPHRRLHDYCYYYGLYTRPPRTRHDGMTGGPTRTTATSSCRSFSAGSRGGGGGRPAVSSGRLWRVGWGWLVLLVVVIFSTAGCIREESEPPGSAEAFEPLLLFPAPSPPPPGAAEAAPPTPAAPMCCICCAGLKA